MLGEQLGEQPYTEPARMHPRMLEELTDVQGCSLTSLKGCAEHRRLSFVAPFWKKKKAKRTI